MMLALLLARAGVEVVVLEKHGDFLRDFRGDTIHSSTLELIEQLGFLDELEALPHQVATRLGADIEGTRVNVFDLSALHGKHRHIYLLPQWDFLALLARKAAEYPSFRLVMNAEVTDLWRDGKRVVGVVYRHEGKTKRLSADLTVACNGRDSILRHLAGARPIDFGAPMDVLWFQLPRQSSDPPMTAASIRHGRMLVMLDRGDYWQMGYLIPKGSFRRVRERGLERFLASIEQMAPFLEGRTQALTDWDDIRILRVQVNQLARWFYPGLLFIGDAAHAMSPIGGVGINLALQDAVATANIVTESLLHGKVTMRTLARVQRRRWLPAAVTQALQLTVQHRVIRPILGGQKLRPPKYLPRLLALRPVRRIVARALGRGVRPERWHPHLENQKVPTDGALP
jgi:2-polyprenyl-6-methoxyphenol hydroxylase-like FAD-dependent oxidoreductase